MGGPTKSTAVEDPVRRCHLLRTRLVPATRWTDGLRGPLHSLGPPRRRSERVSRPSGRRPFPLRQDAQRAEAAQALPAPRRGGKVPTDLRAARYPEQPRGLPLSRLRPWTQRACLSSPLRHRGQAGWRSPARVSDGPAASFTSTRKGTYGSSFRPASTRSSPTRPHPRATC
jgi:hypothetical protein